MQDLYASVDGSELKLCSEESASVAYLRRPHGIPSSDFKEYARIRINALPTRKRVNRGKAGPTRCRACGLLDETLAHVSQACQRTHDGRIMRHDCLVKRITGGLREKRYEVEVEHLYKLHGGNLKPDIVATISDETRGRVSVICDVQVVSGAEPRTWHSCKVDKYADRADLKAAIRARHLSTDVQTVAATLTWRGVWVPESFRELRELGLSRGLLEGLVTRVLRGTQLSWYAFNQGTLTHKARTGVGTNASIISNKLNDYFLTMGDLNDYISNKENEYNTNNPSCSSYLRKITRTELYKIITIELADDDIVHLLDIPSDSEDGFESDLDNEQIEMYNEYRDLLEEPDLSTFTELLLNKFPENILDKVVQFPVLDPELDNGNYLNIPSSSSSPEPITIPNNKKTRQTQQCITPILTAPTKPIVVQNIKWTDGNFPVLETDFLGNSDLPNYILELDTPFQIFKYFFTSDLMDHICSETYKYGVQNNSSSPLKISTEDLQKYIGVLVIMSLVNITNIRNYWSPVLGNEIIKNTMTVNTFEKIRSNLHFNDNLLTSTGPNRDKIHKIRPVIETLKKRFSSIPIEENLAVDEQICSTKARSSLKVYMPNKPYKWGYKYFVLSGASGFAYNLEFCTGQENNSELRKTSEPDLGASANVVVRLARVIPINLRHKLFFDNYYTTLPLLVYLKKRNILSSGTVRRNRLKNVMLPDDSLLMKKPRGTTAHCVSKVRGVDIVAVTWKDTKIVSLLSTFAAVDPVVKVSRYDRKQKKRVEVDCPNIIKVYNRHMGGVDLLDGLLGRHKIKMRSRKWYMRVFHHLLDVTIVNSWLLHKRIQKQKEDKNVMSLVHFREELGLSLCKIGTSITPERGRPTNDVQEGIVKKGKMGTKIGQHAPPKEVRTDRTDHWPVENDKRTRCKNPGCKGNTFMMCNKCQVNLCCGKGLACFTKWHTT
ncbi:hypothetical protein QTP88_021176 [Uroleucon formosanum]